MPQFEVELKKVVKTIDGFTCTSRRLWLPISLEKKSRGRLPENGLIDTGAPLCVIPYAIHAHHNLKWNRVSCPKSQKFPWFGVRCDIGRIQVWLTDDTQKTCGPFLMEAKFPEKTPPEFLSKPAPLLSGMNIFADLQARFDLQSDQDPPGYSMTPSVP